MVPNDVARNGSVLLNFKINSDEKSIWNNKKMEYER